MPLKLYRRPGSKVWHYRGTINGDRVRGSTRTVERKDAENFAAKVQVNHQRSADEARDALTFPDAVAHYLRAGKPSKYLTKIIAHWKDTKVKDMTAGAIRQSAIDIYPQAGGATRNRQVITPTQAVINHCAELELCAPVRIRRFKFEAKIKKPITLDWIETFCAHARPVIKALALCMWSTACRYAEAKRLDWTDFDFPNRTVLIRDTKIKRQRHANMPVPMLIAFANLPRDKAPFYWSETTLRRWWDEDVKATAEKVEGFERLTFHSCRHGFATKMLRDQIDPKTAADLGGWADIGTFMKTYAHAMRDPRLTDRLFGTKVTQKKSRTRKNKGLPK